MIRIGDYLEALVLLGGAAARIAALRHTPLTPVAGNDREAIAM